MSPERKAIIAAIRKTANQFRNDTGTTEVEKAVGREIAKLFDHAAAQLERNIPPAPAERWPRCRACPEHRRENAPLDLNLINDNPITFEVSCGWSPDHKWIGDSPDAAFRAAEQTDHQTPQGVADV